MFQELVMTPATAVVLIAIGIGVVFALKRLFGRGLCDCKDGCGDCEGCCGNTGSCTAADDMVARLEKSLK